jgi:hypothetical protein
MCAAVFAAAALSAKIRAVLKQVARKSQNPLYRKITNFGMLLGSEPHVRLLLKWRCEKGSSEPLSLPVV